MGKVLNWVINLIPQQYRIGVAIKKVSYTIGKLVAGFMTAKLVTTGKLTAEQCSQIELALTTVAAGGLEWLHDWARMKWPQATWL